MSASTTPFLSAPWQSVRADHPLHGFRRSVCEDSFTKAEGGVRAVSQHEPQLESIRDIIGGSLRPREELRRGFGGPREDGLKVPLRAAVQGRPAYSEAPKQVCFCCFTDLPVF